jgi:septum formation protein
MENGSWQSVYSGLAIICKKQNKAVAGFDITKCKARFLDGRTLKSIARRHMDKAGAYAMQDKDDMFIERIIGSYDNVVGMPSELFKKMMKEFGND